MLLKTVAKTALRNRAANWAFRTALRPLLARSRGRVWGREIPVVGTVPIVLPDGERIVMTTDGADRLAWYFSWGGFDGYEPETAALFRLLAKKSSVILDIGAYSGYFSLLAAHGNSEATVYAFEPSPHSYKALVRNTGANCVVNVIAQPLAVGDTDGEVQLYLPGDGMPCEASTLRGFRTVAKAIPVAQVSLDSWFRHMGVERVDLIKLDTEGTEHLVLRGATDMLATHAPCIVCEVLHGGVEGGLENVLSQFDYKYFHITDTGPVAAASIVGDPTARLRNYLFCPYEALNGPRDACEVCPAAPTPRRDRRLLDRQSASASPATRTQRGARIHGK